MNWLLVKSICFPKSTAALRPGLLRPHRALILLCFPRTEDVVIVLQELRQSRAHRLALREKRKKKAVDVGFFKPAEVLVSLKMHLCCVNMFLF